MNDWRNEFFKIDWSKYSQTRVEDVVSQITSMSLNNDQAIELIGMHINQYKKLDTLIKPAIYQEAIADLERVKKAMEKLGK